MTAPPPPPAELVDGLTELRLEHGPLRFPAWAAGDPAAPLVLCLHGFPDAPWTWRRQLPALAEAGYYAVAPTIRGYAPSAAPADPVYKLDACATDVTAWADALGAARFHLVGHDWGAIIAYWAATAAPERVATLSTLAVPPTWRFMASTLRVPRQLLKSWYVFAFQGRGLSVAAASRGDHALLKRLWRDWSPNYALSDLEWRALQTQFAQPGVTANALRYYQQNLSPAWMLSPSGGAPAGLPIQAPTLAITGADDGCVDTRIYDHAFRPGDFAGALRIERLVGAGHFAQLEQPDQVTALLLDGLSRATL
ncbi:MAG: alpha/beta fold hydrolase [Pseudomonadota bacterium]